MSLTTDTLSSAFIYSTLSIGTKCVARPFLTMSSPVIRVIVSAMNRARGKFAGLNVGMKLRAEASLLKYM